MRARSLIAGLVVAAAALLGVTATAGTAAAAPPLGGGVYNPDIVGGTPATAYSFMASLQSYSSAHRCGASLVHANWAVTAKHCVQGQSPANLRLRIGTATYNSGGTLAPIAQFYNHPSYDMALIRLSVSVSNTPIRIAASSGAIGTRTRLLGWGQTCASPGGCGAPIQLQQLDTSIVGDAGCAGGGVSATYEICTGNPNGWRGACYGDSGGPQIKTVGGAWELIGATSRSGGGSTCGINPSIYEDVPAFRPWIQSTTGLPL